MAKRKLARHPCLDSRYFLQRPQQLQTEIIEPAGLFSVGYRKFTLTPLFFRTYFRGTGGHYIETHGL